MSRMRYFSYSEPTSSEDSTPIDITLSEDEIIHEYWDYWYDKMCAKFGKDHVDQNYNILDCIDDWVVVHWAWESKD